MTHSPDLQELKERLHAALAGRPRLVAQETTEAARQRLIAARDALAPPRGHRALPRLAQAVMSFRMQGRNSPWPELKYSCHACARPVDWGGRVLIEEAELFGDLLTAVDALEGKAFRACYRGLLIAWLVDLDDEEALTATARNSKTRLETFLQTGIARAQNGRRETAWTRILADRGLQRSDDLRLALGLPLSAPARSG